jgi:hypothetical protein
LVKISDAQKELFDNLRRINADVVEDGVVDEDEYLSTSPRIMYVLKDLISRGRTGRKITRNEGVNTLRRYAQ